MNQAKQLGESTTKLKYNKKEERFHDWFCWPSTLKTP